MEESQTSPIPCWMRKARLALVAIATAALGMQESSAQNLKIGIIGLDTSHAEQFTMRLNDPAHPNHVPGGRIVAAYASYSKDLEESASRVEGFTATVRDKYGVAILDSIEAVCAEVDAIMLLSLDGRPHIEQIKPILAAGKRVFVDKPVAASLKEAIEIYKMADQVNVPIFSASSLRWYPGVVEVAAAAATPPDAVLSYGPAPILPFHPDLFFYGIHATEALFTVMGEGCQSVTRTSTPASSVVVGVWRDGRSGTLHAMHQLPQGSTDYKVIRFDGDLVTAQKSQGDYTPMLREIIQFFQTSTPPVSAQQTLEIYGFMEAAEESKRRNGIPIKLRDIMQKAGAPEKWLPAQEAPKVPAKGD